MEQVVTNLQQQLSSQQQTLQARIRTDVEPVAPRQHRAFIESRAFSKLTNFDSKAASWKDWRFKFENMAASVVPSSREAQEWAAQQETPIWTVDDVEAGLDSVEIDLQVYVALAELLEGESLDIVQNTTRGAGLEAIEQWEQRVRSYQSRAREKISDDVRSGILTEMCPEHITSTSLVCQIRLLFARKSKRLLKRDSPV